MASEACQQAGPSAVMRVHRHGNHVLATYAAGDTAERPLLVVLHGALRSAQVLMSHLLPWPGQWDLLFVDLPGHGRSSPLLPATAEGFAQRVAQAVRALHPGRDHFVLGESLGGLVALAMGGLGETRLKGVIAADPPLTTAKLWHVAQAVRSALTRSPESRFMRSFAADIFGIAESGIPAERIYYPVLDRLRVPALILTGDVPLLPPRRSRQVPCVVDDVDRFVIERLYRERVIVEVLPGCGHLVLFDATARCRELIGCFAVAT